MGLRINQNIDAFNSYRNLSATQGDMSRSLEKLSSGLRINRAADDAAGLAISEGLRTQIGGLKVAARNAQDGISVVQTAEGALTEVHAILQRMRDLAVQSANGSNNQASRDALQAETEQLKEELNRISSSTSFNGVKLLDGTFTSTSFQVGSDAADSIEIMIGLKVPAATPATFANTVDLENDYSGTPLTFTIDGVAVSVSRNLAGADGDTVATALQAAYDSARGGLDEDYRFDYDETANSLVVTSTSRGPGATAPVVTGGIAAGTPTATAGAASAAAPTYDAMNTAGMGIDTLDISSADGATAALNSLSTAITKVSTVRADLGAIQNRFEHTIANVNVAVENLSASESRIRDTDMAMEMTSFTRSQILSQAGTAMLAQANQSMQGVLRLLQG
ncbi:flagellin [Nocardioidaceae bacterium]|nr:flagellin [Nocardioidaceae bacterium]